jgi:hypothetical protein
MDRRAEGALGESDDLAGFGVAAQGCLGEDQLTVEGHLEAALGAREKVERLDDRRPSRQEFVRQTDGSRDVVSGDAELDGDAVARLEHDHDATGRRRGR